MNIQDDKQYMIFAKDYQGKMFYKIGLSKKEQNGKYINGYLDCKFAKCTPPKDKEKIYLTNAFLSFYLSKDKHTIPYLVIMDYKSAEQVIEESKSDIVKQNTKDEFKDLGTRVELDDLDLDPELPF